MHCFLWLIVSSFFCFLSSLCNCFPSAFYFFVYMKLFSNRFSASLYLVLLFSYGVYLGGENVMDTVVNAHAYGLPASTPSHACAPFFPSLRPSIKRPVKLNKLVAHFHFHVCEWTFVPGDHRAQEALPIIQLDFKKCWRYHDGNKRPRRMLLGRPLDAWFCSCWISSSWSSWSSQWLQIFCNYCKYIMYKLPCKFALWFFWNYTPK